MEYNLAKKLKKAGFPQEPFWQVDVNAWGGSWYHIAIKDACPNRIFFDTEEYKYRQKSPISFIKIPTLSELIEECVKLSEDNGDFHLERNPQLVRKELWGASIDCFKNESYIFGKTAEEAVAHLWLKLQKSVK